MFARRAWPVFLALAAACSSSSSTPAPRAQPAQSVSAAAPRDAVPPAPASKGLPQPDFLKHIPADTPFLFAALSPLPPDYAVREYVSRLAAYQSVRPAVEELRRRRPRELGRLGFMVRLQLALLDELGGVASRERMVAIGFDPATVGALYGVGMNPVVRIRLSDAARFSAALARMTARLQPIQKAELAGQRYYAAREDTLVWILAVAGSDLVVALVPPAQIDQWMPVILGQRPPERSLAGDRRLDQLATQYGLSPVGIGYADVSGMAQALGSALPAPCRDELVALSAAVPRVAVGLTAASAGQMRVRSAVELRADLAASLASMRGQLPGGDLPGGAALAVVAGVDIPAMVTWLSGALRGVAASPFRCPSLGWLNELASSQGSTLRRAATTLAGVRGASLSVRDIAGLASGSADIFLVLGSDRPRQVLRRVTRALGVGAPKLRPGGPPAELPSALGGAFGVVHVALAPRALGLSLGADGSELANLLTASAADDPPLFAVHLDPQALGPILRLGGTAGDPRIAAVDPDLARNLAELELAAFERFDQLRITARATPRGLDIDFDGSYAR